MTKYKPPLMDFTYLYDTIQADFADFTAGRIFTEDEVFADIQSPENWTHREGSATLWSELPNRRRKSRNFSMVVVGGA